MTTMTQETLLRQITDYANRANPYPLYAQLRETPVSRQEDGAYVVSTYREIVELLHDPRISSDLRKRSQAGDEQPQPSGLLTSFLGLDPPEHDRLRRLSMRQFGPPHRPGLVESIRLGMASSAGWLGRFGGWGSRGNEGSGEPEPSAPACCLSLHRPQGAPRGH